MKRVTKEIQYEDSTFYFERYFNDEVHQESLDVFQKCKEKGFIESDFDDDYWNMFSGVKHFGASFLFDEDNYKKWLIDILKMSPEAAKTVIKCFVLTFWGQLIQNSISNIVKTIVTFFSMFGQSNYKVTLYEKGLIEAFLYYISSSEEDVKYLLHRIEVKKEGDKNSRKLSPMINYLAAQDAVEKLYSSTMSKEEYIKWFPIYYWVAITFILPLRATEMILTPFNCIIHEDGKIFLLVRRTKLKKHRHHVCYNVADDYELFKYEVPNTGIIRAIEQYQEYTRNHKRNYLFEFDESLSINKLFSLQAFNKLLGDFMEAFVIGSVDYDFAKYAANIDEFEKITAGDSRPIAMVNLYFSGISADICRQLANHEKIDTSAGYYANIDETVWSHSIFEIQKKYNERNSEFLERIGRSRFQIRDDDDPVYCDSEKRKYDKENIEDCRKEGFFDECIGCPHYYPTKSELENYLKKYEELFNKESKELIEIINRAFKPGKPGLDITELFLTVQKDTARYKLGTDVKCMEIFKKWEESKNTQI